MNALLQACGKESEKRKRFQRHVKQHSMPLVCIFIISLPNQFINLNSLVSGLFPSFEYYLIICYVVVIALTRKNACHVKNTSLLWIY